MKYVLGKVSQFQRLISMVEFQSVVLFRAKESVVQQWTPVLIGKCLKIWNSTGRYEGTNRDTDLQTLYLFESNGYGDIEQGSFSRTGFNYWTGGRSVLTGSSLDFGHSSTPKASWAVYINSETNLYHSIILYHIPGVIPSHPMKRRSVAHCIPKMV